MMQSGVAVLCGNCHSLLAAPFGHPVIRCGSCGVVLRLTEELVRPPPSHDALLRQMHEAAERARAGGSAAGASKTALAQCRRFVADEAFASQGIMCPISAEEIRVTQIGRAHV